MRNTVTILMLLAAAGLGCAKKAGPPAAQTQPALQRVDRLPRIEPAPPKPVRLKPVAPAPVAPKPVAGVGQPKDKPERAADVTTRPARFVTHRIAKNDTLWSLARRYLGDPKRWPEIQQANPGLDPRTLQIGQAIKIPTE